MENKCINCKYFTASAPWCGRCTKSGAPANYSKAGCGSFKPATPAELKKTRQRVDYYKARHAENCDDKLFKMD